MRGHYGASPWLHAASDIAAGQPYAGGVYAPHESGIGWFDPPCRLGGWLDATDCFYLFLQGFLNFWGRLNIRKWMCAVC